MIKAFSLTLSLAALGCSSGCLFWKKSDRPKESSAISAEVEANFRQRWVERRASELVAAGSAPDVAQARAETEFIERYPYTRPAQK